MPIDLDYDGVAATQEFNVTLTGDLAAIGTQIPSTTEFGFACSFDGQAPNLQSLLGIRSCFAAGNPSDSPSFFTVALQTRFEISGGNLRVSVYARHGGGTTIPFVDIPAADIASLGRRCVIYARFRGGDEAQIVVHDRDNDATYTGAAISLSGTVGTWRLRVATTVVAGASDGFPGNSDRQAIGGILGPCVIFDTAHPISEGLAMAQLGDLAALVMGPSNAWASSVVWAGFHNENSGSTTIPKHVAGEPVNDGELRIPIYRRGSSAANDFESFFAATDADITVNMTSGRTITCADSLSLGWAPTDNGTIGTLPGASVAGVAGSVRSVLSSVTPSGITRLMTIGNSRSARRVADSSIIPVFPTYTDPVGIFASQEGSAGNWHTGLIESLGDRAVGGGTRVWSRQIESSVPFYRLSALATDEQNATLVEATTTGFDEGLCRLGVASGSDASSGVEPFDAFRINPDNWNSDGDSFIEIGHAAEKGMDPAADRVIRVLLWSSAMMSSSVDVRIFGRSAKTGKVVLPTVVASLDLSKPNLAQGVGIVSAAADIIQLDGAIPNALIGHAACFRRASQPGTQVGIILGKPTDSRITLDFEPSTSLTDSDTVELSDYEYVLLEVEVPASLIGTGVGQIPSNVVGIQIQNNDATAPVYGFAKEAHEKDASGVVVHHAVQGGRSYESLENRRPKTPHPVTGRTPFIAALVAMGIDGAIFTGADQGAGAGAGATAVADAFRDLATECIAAGIDAAVFGEPIQGNAAGDWESETDRVDFWNKVRGHCITLGIPYVSGYDTLGGVPSQYAHGLRFDAAHHTALGAKLWADEMRSRAEGIVQAPTPSTNFARSRSSAGLSIAAGL